MIRLPKAITQRNNISREDFLELENRLGGPVAAAETAGVSYPTWYRWRERKIPLSRNRQKLIAMMLQTTHMPLSARKGETR